VTLVCEADDDRARINAQLELLEPERRPLLIASTTELSAGQRFDWIGGRLGSGDLVSFDWQQLAFLLDHHGERHSGLRLLVSNAQAGPAGVLIQQTPGLMGLESFVEQEQQWLQTLQPQTEALEAAGWILQSTRWQETIVLEGGKTLVERWLQNGSQYRCMLGEQSQNSLSMLRRLLEQHGEQDLGLPLQHLLISGSRPAI